jgi:hypothetical protein
MAEVETLLDDLSFSRIGVEDATGALRFTANVGVESNETAPDACLLFQADGFCGYEHGTEFSVTDGDSRLHVQPRLECAEAFLAETFFARPVWQRRNFWAFAVMKLLRALGWYSLHAAGVVSPKGVGVLIVGVSGSGKSTLVLGLLRQGWHYLSDDALLLREYEGQVHAMALRRSCFVDADAVWRINDLPLGEERPDTTGRARRRVAVDTAYPRQYRAKCAPRVILFPQLTHRARSALAPLARATAIPLLLTQSGPQLFDRQSMPDHLQLLAKLTRQATLYELQAGTDLLHELSTVSHLLASAEGSNPWSES